MTLTHINTSFSNQGGQAKFANDLASGLAKYYQNIFISKKNVLNLISDSLEKHHVFIIHNPLHLFSILSLLLITIRKNSSKRIVIFHSKAFSNNRLKRFFLNIKIQVFLLITAKLATDLVFLTQADKNFFTKRLSALNYTKFHIIPNFISQTSQNIKQYKSVRPLVVTYISPSKISKGFLTFCRVVEFSRCFPVYFINAGNSHIIRNKNVINVGYLSNDQIESILGISDVLFYPSYSECFPLTILEAMTHNTLVLSSNIFGLPSIVSPETTGNFVCDPSDLQCFVRKLYVYTQCTKSNLDVLKRINQLRVVQYYSKQSVISKYRKIISD